MLRWALIFLVIGLIAGVLGFTGVAGASIAGASGSSTAATATAARISIATIGGKPTIYSQRPTDGRARRSHRAA